MFPGELFYYDFLLERYAGAWVTHHLSLFLSRLVAMLLGFSAAVPDLNKHMFHPHVEFELVL